MLILGIETRAMRQDLRCSTATMACLRSRLHSQADMHIAYGGVVPELASRDHISRVLPLLSHTLNGAARVEQIDAIAVTAGPVWPERYWWVPALATHWGTLERPVYSVHHMEGHLLSPMLSRPAPDFPFIAPGVRRAHAAGTGR